MAMILNGTGDITGLASVNSSVTAAEIGYLDGTTSAIQTQIDGKLTVPGTWIDYVPTWTNLTIGNATVAARYTQIGKTVHTFIGMVWGSTTVATASAFVPSLPVNAYSNAVGTGWAFDASATVWQTCVFRANNYILAPTAGRFTSTVPWTWTTNDIIHISITYEAA